MKHQLEIFFKNQFKLSKKYSFIENYLNTIGVRDPKYNVQIQKFSVMESL